MLEHSLDRLRADAEVLASTGLKDHEAQVRQEIGRRGALVEHWHRAATDIEGCARRWVQYECRHGHSELRLWFCSRTALCESCAQRDAARRRAIYEARLQAAQERAPAGVRPRFITLSYRPAESEDDPWGNLQRFARHLYRVMMGRPHSAEDWAVYWIVYPLTQAEVDRQARVTPGGRRRSAAARVRSAMAARRKWLVRRRERWGALAAYEWGEEGRRPHVHFLALTPWIEQPRLSYAWLLCTGTSYYADIRRQFGRLAEPIKYALKFATATAAELVDLHERQLLASRDDAGNWRVSARRRLEGYGALRSRADDAEDLLNRPPAKCETCGEPVRAVGELTDAMRRMGISSVPQQCRWRARRPRDDVPDS